MMKKTPDTRFKLSKTSRKRGISMIEAVLYLAVASSVLVLTAQIADTESKRQVDISTAAAMNLYMTASQRYIAAEYDAIRVDLLNAAITTGEAQISLTMQDLADRGYLPNAITVEPTNVFGQEYALLMRAVEFDDVATPAATMPLLSIDSNSDGAIDNTLIDGNNTNNEMTIEAILVTFGGETIGANRGAPISVRTQKPTAGFVETAGTAVGAYGTFSFDISGFNTFPEYPDAGNFANIISLSRFSLVEIEGPGITPTSSIVSDPLRRCEEILNDPAQTPTSPLYTSCLATNAMYSDIVFQSYDLDGDGIIDSTPGIVGLDSIEFATPLDTDTNPSIDRFPYIEGLYDLDFGGGFDTDGDTIPDRFSIISKLAEIQCGDGARQATVNGTLIIDCPEIEVTGNIEVDGDIEAIGRATAERFISASNGDQDLSEGVYSSLLLASGDLVDKPVCPATTADGLFLMEPRIFVAPAAYSHPGGIPSVGIRAFAEDVSPTQWRVSLFNFVDEDVCVSDISNPLTLNTVNFRAENAAACSTNDGNADVYEIPGSIGRILTMTRCF